MNFMPLKINSIALQNKFREDPLKTIDIKYGLRMKHTENSC